MIKVIAKSGPLAGQVREMPDEINPDDLFRSFIVNDWEWQVDYSQATGVEALRWGLSDLSARAFRSIRKGLPVRFMGKLYSDPIELEDAIVYSGRGVSLGRDDKTGLEIMDFDLPKQEPEPLAMFRLAQEWIEVHCQELVEAGKVLPSWQNKNAFSRAVTVLVTGLPLGTLGGPTVREYAAVRQFGKSRWTFEEAAGVLSRDDGLIFGPLTGLHRQCWEEHNCYGDDPDDVQKLSGNASSQ